jgi:hypothetical protein
VMSLLKCYQSDVDVLIFATLNDTKQLREQ